MLSALSTADPKQLPITLDPETPDPVRPRPHLLSAQVSTPTKDKQHLLSAQVSTGHGLEVDDDLGELDVSFLFQLGQHASSEEHFGVSDTVRGGVKVQRLQL